MAASPRLALVLILTVLAALVAGCAGGRSSLAVSDYDTSYAGPRSELTVGRFSNASTYLRGVFTGPDRVGNQARELLEAHLARTNRFELREPELGLSSREGEGVVVTGQVTALGPGAGDGDTVLAGVTLNVVEVATSRVVTSVRGEAETELAPEEAAAYRASLEYGADVTRRALDRALSRAVGALVDALAGAPAAR